MENNIKLAIPVFEARISPWFEYAGTFLIVQIENREISEKKELSTNEWSPFQRIGELVNYKINEVICGGISMFSARQLAYHNIRVWPCVCGGIDEVLNNFLKGNIKFINAQTCGKQGRGFRQFRKRFRGGRNFNT